jgi:hypothetical protein
MHHNGIGKPLLSPAGVGTAESYLVFSAFCIFVVRRVIGGGIPIPKIPEKGTEVRGIRFVGEFKGVKAARFYGAVEGVDREIEVGHE